MKRGCVLGRGRNSFDARIDCLPHDDWASGIQRPMPYLKTEALPEVGEVLKRSEDQADECWRALGLRYYPSNVGIWGLLTGGIRIVEREHAARSSNTPHFDAMLNVL